MCFQCVTKIRSREGQQQTLYLHLPTSYNSTHVHNRRPIQLQTCFNTATLPPTLHLAWTLCPLRLDDMCKVTYRLLYSCISSLPKESFSPAWGLVPGSSSACALVEQAPKTLTLLHCQLLPWYNGLHQRCHSMHKQHVPVCDLEMSKQPCRQTNFDIILCSY